MREESDDERCRRAGAGPDRCRYYAGAGVDCVIYGPTGDGFHGDDEYVEIDSLVRATKVIAAAVIDYCGVKGV